jgi:plasmid maintenance system antidote protein VapI
VLTPAEVARIRLAISNALPRFRTWERLAEAMGVHRDTVRLAGVRHTLTAGVAYRFAKATGTTIDAILSTTLRVVPGGAP